MQNNQLPTKRHVELEDNYIIIDNSVFGWTELACKLLRPLVGLCRGFDMLLPVALLMNFGIPGYTYTLHRSV